MILPQVALFTAFFTASDNTEHFDSALSNALQVCIALAPENRSKLGGVDPEEVTFWLKASRLQASQAFWSANGEAYLSRKLASESRATERACIRQLVIEAHTRGQSAP